MQPKTKRKLKITALVLAGLFLVCVILAGCIVLPEALKKQKRYAQTKNFANGKMQIVAHRGASGLALENTVFAFEEAGRREYYGIEADARLTLDGKFIIAHDSDLERFGLDIRIDQTDFATLRALRLKDIYANSNEETCFLPTVEEYIEICKKYNKQAVLELKGEILADKIWELAQDISALGWFEKTTFISFDREHLTALRRSYPNANAQYIVKKVKKGDIEFMLENKIDGNFFWASVTPARVRKLHKAGLKVNCWTVDTRACALYMRVCGVDMLTTNILE